VLLKRLCVPTLAALTLAGCVGDDQDDSDPATARSFDFSAMMANYADNLIRPQAQTFAEQTSEMSDGPLADYCAAIGTESEAQALAEARSSWRQTMDLWQENEVLQIGPLSQNGGALRNRIYSFGTTSTSTCGVDQSVVLAQDPDFDLSSRAVGSRGLDALEYLLFNNNLDHTCPAQIVETQDWNQRPDEQRKAWRCDYAQELARDIETAAGELVAAWDPEQGDYRFSLVNPTRQEENLEALSDALFFIELDTKDRKVGVPTGINDGCSAIACPEDVESPFSQTSLDNVRANLVAFRRALNGGEGLGFDDIIRSEGFASVVEDFNREIDDALAQLDAMDTSLYADTRALLESGDRAACENSAANPETIQAVPSCSLHGLLKRITDRLRTDFITIVDLDLPDRGQADND